MGTLAAHEPPTAAGGGHSAVVGVPVVRLWDYAEKQVLPAALKCLQGKPFPETRMFTWRLLAVLSQSRNLAQRQLTSPELQELLFDFTSEQNSDARMAKHEFVAALVKWHGG